MSKKALTEKEKWAIYGLNRPPKPRYSGIKGIYWAVVSEYVRRRDFGLWGVCVNCGREVAEWRVLHAGHFVPADRCGFKLVFDLKNINGECPACNKWDKRKIRYSHNLDVRWGRGTAKKLEKRYMESLKKAPAKEWSLAQYDKEIRALQGAIEAL